MPSRPDRRLRWFAAAFIAALALPALVLLILAGTGVGGAGALLAGRLAGAVVFSVLAVVVWLRVGRPRR